MLFLIDYENVGNMGMKGCDYLNASDHMIVFYSEAQMHMERQFWKGSRNPNAFSRYASCIRAGRMRWIFISPPSLEKCLAAASRNSGDRQSR